MTAIIIPNNQMAYPFGQQTNQAIGRLVSLNASLGRLGEAISTANSGFSGEPGTQFETGNTDPKNVVPNLFGIQADPANPGQQGQAYSYAMGRLSEEWLKFWAVAKDFVEALDNGQVMM